MQIPVAVKRVVDINVKMRVKSEGSSVEIATVKRSMNSFDGIAAAEAMQLQEKDAANAVLEVAYGVTQWQETLRTAIASEGCGASGIAAAWHA